MKNDVIVGVDGSAPSRTALRWAAAEAARRGVHLRVLLAYHWRWPGSYGATAEIERIATEQAETTIAEAVDEARAAQPGLDVTGTAVLGIPAQVLLGAARSAALVVVGNRGHHGFAAALTGSVSQQVATHAPCPVVVVRGRGESASGPLIVAVDGSLHSELTLGVAFEEAAMRGCDLVAIRAFTPATPPWGVDVPPLPYSTTEVKATLHADLHDSLTPWREKFPQVPVEELVAQGNAAHVLTDVSRGAQLLVVGSRGHGGFAGLLLGSVGMHLLHHADCPVLVVRTDTERP